MRLENEDVLLHWPLAQHIITAGWLYNDGSLHRALDFRAAVGTPVYAAEGGTVETAYRWNGKRTQGDNNSYGNMIKLRHTTYKYGTLETLYAHLSQLCVAQGAAGAGRPADRLQRRYRQLLWSTPAFRGALERPAHEPTELAGC